MPNKRSLQRQLRALAPEDFTPQWAGYATCKKPYATCKSQTGSFCQFIQRFGERAEDRQFNAFLATCDRDEVTTLARDYPQRRHIEEFFNSNQALGWGRAGTLNLPIRYGQMTMSLRAQTVIHQLRRRLGEPHATWDAAHLAQSLFRGLDGDLRVTGDTILVTFYNAPHPERLRLHYEHLPQKTSRSKH